MKNLKILHALVSTILSCCLGASADPLSKSAAAPKQTPATVRALSKAADRWVGTYVNPKTEGVTVTRISISKRPDGRLKLKASTNGLPEQVSDLELEGDAEIYAPIGTGQAPVNDKLMTKFTAGRFKTILIVSAKNSGRRPAQVDNLTFSYYMRQIDGSTMHIAGEMKRL